jgi:hypothetical protein
MKMIKSRFYRTEEKRLLKRLKKYGDNHLLFAIDLPRRLTAICPGAIKPGVSPRAAGRFVFADAAVLRGVDHTMKLKRTDMLEFLAAGVSPL